MSCRHLPRTKYRRIREEGGYDCLACGAYVSPEQQRKGRTNRDYSIDAELKAARKYGGKKTNDGGPLDIIGRDWEVQMKAHRRPVYKEWREAFDKMPGDRLKRLLIRFVLGPGRAPVDFYVIPADDFLDWYGLDE